VRLSVPAVTLEPVSRVPAGDQSGTTPTLGRRARRRPGSYHGDPSNAGSRLSTFVHRAPVERGTRSWRSLISAQAISMPLCLRGTARPIIRRPSPWRADSARSASVQSGQMAGSGRVGGNATRSSMAVNASAIERSRMDRFIDHRRAVPGVASPRATRTETASIPASPWGDVFPALRRCST